MTTLELGENGAPGGLHGALKMHRLHAHQRQSLASREQASRARAFREANVFLQSAPQPVFLIRIDFEKGHEIAVKHILGFGPRHISKAAGHAGTEIQAEWPENDGDAAGHILATVLADAFDYSKRAAVADREAFASAAGNEEVARSGAVENGVAGKNVPAPGSGEARGDRNDPAGKSFSDVVVRFTLELECYALGKECAKALARSTMKILPNLFIPGQAVLALAHQFPAQTSANAAIGILDRLRLILEPESRIEMKRFFKRANVEGRFLLRRDAIRGGDWHNQKRIHSRAGTEAVVPAGELAK